MKGGMLSVRDYIFVTIYKLKYVSLEEVKFDPFNKISKWGLQKETYLGYVWGYLGQGQNSILKRLTDSR